LIPLKRLNCRPFSWLDPVQENAGEFVEYCGWISSPMGAIPIGLPAINWYVYSGSVKVMLQWNDMDIVKSARRGKAVFPLFRFP